MMGSWSNIGIGVVGVLASTLAFFGLNKKPEETNPTPSSSFTMMTVRYDAEQWALRAPHIRGWCNTTGSSSMLPISGGNAVLLLEKSDGSNIAAGDIAVYDDLKGGLISHRVVAVYEKNAVFAGDNNSKSDGLIGKHRVKWKVVGILYAQK